MKRLKVGINGFGRIGRAFTRIAALRNTFDIVQINTRKTPNTMLAYLLKHDSVYRTYELPVFSKETSIEVGGVDIATTQCDDPSLIPWATYNVDVVVDATGAFKKKEDLMKHIRGSVQKVLITAPADKETKHVVLGVNDGMIDWKDEKVISNASCTTNCAAPMFKIVHDAFGIQQGFLTTAHAYTLTQSLLDDAGKDVERSRAAALNLIPSTTGAAKAIARVIPDLEGKIDGMAIRVPLPTGSFVDMTTIVAKETSTDEVNQKFRAAAENSMKGVLKCADEIIVSSDIVGDSASCIYDPNYTKVIDGHFVKTFGWYDNEWGYSARLVDVVERFADM